MLHVSDYLPEFWHVGFISPEKHCSEVIFRWVALRFREIMFAKRAHRSEKPSFFAYAISRKRSELKRKNYRTYLNIPELSTKFTFD